MKTILKRKWQAFYSLQRFDIDLSSFVGVYRVSISRSSLNNCIHYIALLPAGEPFQATSYNADGTFFCRFDQTGRMVRVLDQDGHLLESYEHHVVNP